MVKKERKTRCFRDWIVAYLYSEGQIYDGPGKVAAAAIYDFYRKTYEEKKHALKAYADCAIELAYSAGVAPGQVAPKNAARKAVPGATTIHEAVDQLEDAAKAQSKPLSAKGKGRGDERHPA